VLRGIPVNTDRFETAMATAPPSPRIKDRDTGELRVDPEGRTLYQVPVLVVPPGSDGEVIRVSVPGEPTGVTAGVPVRLRDLVAVPWEMERNGHLRWGIAFRASAVEVAA